MKMKNNKGFTLIELIIVTIILGILSAVAVPRYMGTVSKAEEAAEKAVINALRAAVEDYATQQYIEKGRYDYPENPFELVEVDGYCGTCDDGMVDGSWSYTAELDLDPDSPNYGAPNQMYKIVHQRRDNSQYFWHYATFDDSNEPSDDRGINIGMDWLANGKENMYDQQSWLSN